MLLNTDNAWMNLGRSLIKDKKKKKKAKHTLQHMASGGCIDSQSFNTYEEMEEYIDSEVLPVWEKGDYLVCDNVRRIIFDDYKKLR